MANINDFKAKLAGGGARPNQFKVTMPFPGYAQVGGEIEDLAFLCTATSIPAMTIGNINVPFRGRQIKIAGDRSFANWSITVLNDTDFKLRNAFERWQNGINNMTDNEGLSNPVEWDSLANLNILLEIEHVKGIKFSIDDFEKLTSIKSIKNYFNHD